MSAADVAALLRALAAGHHLTDAAEKAGFDSPAAASEALETLAGKQRKSRKKNDAVELELPRPPKTSPFPEGQPAYAYADGASRGNPGPASYGCVYATDGGELPLCGEGQTIGKATNNVAEYRGAIAALSRLLDWGVEEAVVRLDSQLVVKQLDGSYRVKNEGLKPLHQQAKSLAARFHSVRFEHVRREKNALADAMANRALDS